MELSLWYGSYGLFKASSFQTLFLQGLWSFLQEIWVNIKPNIFFLQDTISNLF
jgi:hypothetical protein